MNLKIAITSIMSLAILGCAQIHGNVVAYENGKYEATSIGANKMTVLKVADNDAKVTCKKAGRTGYRVISQEVAINELEDVATGVKLLDAVGKVALYAERSKQKDKYEAKTKFRCT
ncbi:MAG: hypothetical protein ACR2P1_01600 [Pseudomonadales bacterium]